MAMGENYFPHTKGVYVAELEQRSAYRRRMNQREIVIARIGNHLRAVASPAALDTECRSARSAVGVRHDESVGAPDNSGPSATGRVDLDDRSPENMSELFGVVGEPALEGSAHAACPPRSRGVTRMVCCVPARVRTMSMGVPSGADDNASTRSDGRASGLPPIPTRRSPSRTPATSAGSPSASATTMSATPS